MTLILLVLAYLLGSIPFGLLLTRIGGVGDIRKLGSGNIGATNVMRTGHKGLAALTLLLDGGKGFIAVEMTSFMHMGYWGALAGFCAVIGHIFPIWLRFNGGKGVATAIGVFFALDWMLGLTVCGLWLLAFLLVRVSSLSALLSFGYSPIFAYLTGNDAATILCLVLALLILYTHRQNITRLLKGTERSFNI